MRGCQEMKKVVMILAILTLTIFLVGCLDYKTTDTNEQDELDLIDDITSVDNDINSPNDNEQVTVDEVTQSEGEYLITANENELVDLTATIVDPDNDEVTYQFSPPLNENGRWQTHYGDAGEYLVTLSATDGQLTTEGLIRLVINRVNVAPMIAALSNIQVDEGETVTFEPEVTDPNGDPVTVSVSGPLRDGTFATDHTSAGQYQITVTASDGELTSEESFTLTVTDVNVLPEVMNLEPITVKEGDTVTIQPEVTDLDGDEVSITISEPVGNDGVWETSFTDHGEYMVRVTVSDGKDTVTQQVRVFIEDVNMPPQIVDVTADIE